MSKRRLQIPLHLKVPWDPSRRAVKRKAHGRNTVFPSVTNKRQHVLGTQVIFMLSKLYVFLQILLRPQCMHEAHIIQKEGGREYIKNYLFSCHPSSPIYSYYYQIFNFGQYLYLQYKFGLIFCSAFPFPVVST